MGKKIKAHRKKVAARNESLNIEKKNMQKMQHKFLSELIERERLAGKFEGVVNDETQVIGASVPVLTEQTGPLF